MLSLKPGVSIRNLRPQMIVAIIIVEGIFKKYGFDTVITSGNDGDHGDGSIHPFGWSLDFRTRHLPNQDMKKEIEEDCRDRLGKDFDVVLETTHLHIEYDPK